MIVKLPNGHEFRLLSTEKLTLKTKIRIQNETGYGPVKLAAGLAGVQALAEAMGELPDIEAGASLPTDLLAKLAESGDIDLMALGCLFWGSRLQQGEPEITFLEACDFEDSSAVFEIEPHEKRAAEEAARTPRPTQAEVELLPAVKRSAGPPRVSRKSTSTST